MGTGSPGCGEVEAAVQVDLAGDGHDAAGAGLRDQPIAQQADEVKVPEVEGPDVAFEAGRQQLQLRRGWSPRVEKQEVDPRFLQGWQEPVAICYRVACD